MYGTLDSTAAAYRTRTGVEPPVPVEDEVPVEVPDSSWLKADIVGWLEDHGIDAPSAATKAELLDLVD